MQVSIETTSDLERRMKVTLPADHFEGRVDEKLREAARQVRLPGFRPGRVPMKEVRRRFGPGVRQEVAGELMQSSFVEAVQQESLRPAGQPALEVAERDREDDFEFTATFEVMPEVSPADVSSLEITRLNARIGEADVDAMIERLREQRREFVARDDRRAEEGDEVTLDFTGYRGDEPFEGGTAEDAKLVIGSGRMIPGFEDELVGLAPGEEKSFEVTFPEDYGTEALAGQTARFDVSVKQVAESVLPALDEAFFEAFGVEEGGVEKFREEVRENMERELRSAVRQHLKNQVMDGLARIHDVPLPASLVHEEIHGMQHEMAKQFGGANMDPHQLPAELFRERAEHRVKLGLVLSGLVEAEGIEADPTRVEALLDDIAAPYGEPEQVKAWYHQNPQQMQQLRSAAIEDQVVDRVLEKATVHDETSTYDEVMAAASQQGGDAAGNSEADAGSEAADTGDDAAEASRD